MCGSGFGLKFFRIVVLWKRLPLDSKTDLTANGVILEFSVGMCLVSSFRRLRSCMDSNRQELFKCDFVDSIKSF